MIRARIIARSVAVFVVLLAARSQAEVITFLDDFEGFLEAAGDVQVIDFETLPDGSPSVAGTLITPDFNYTDQGVTFTVPVPSLYIAGNEVNGFGLYAQEDEDTELTEIVSDLVTPASAVGVDFPGFTTLLAYDEQGELIASEYFGGPGGHFIGLVSDTPIAYTVNTRYAPAEYLHAYYFTPVPEPASGLILACCAVGGGFCGSVGCSQPGRGDYVP